MNPEYNEYFETVARNHKQIGHTYNAVDDTGEKHFTHVELGELENDVVVQLKTPLLAITSPIYKGSGNHANLRWDVTGAVLILDKLDDENDFAKAQELIKKCRLIAESIEAKMIKDRKDWDQNQLQHVLPGLEENAFEIRPLHYEWRPMVGVMMTFGWNVPRARFNAALWNNENEHRL